MQVQSGAGHPVPDCTPPPGALLTRLAPQQLDRSLSRRHRAVSVASISASVSRPTIAACIVG
jgi:hypothetical protein